MQSLQGTPFLLFYQLFFEAEQLLLKRVGDVLRVFVSSSTLGITFTASALSTSALPALLHLVSSGCDSVGEALSLVEADSTATKQLGAACSAPLLPQLAEIQALLQRSKGAVKKKKKSAGRGQQMGSGDGFGGFNKESRMCRKDVEDLMKMIQMMGK